MASSSSRRPRPSSPSPVSAHPLEDDNLLHEIMLRLPPQPPYLLHASIVSKRWRRLATDPKFLRRFRIHHRKPPLLCVFSCTCGYISFRSTLDPPYRIPPERFSLHPPIRSSQRCLDCRHGRVLIDDCKRSRVIVWDPITDDRHVVTYPPQFHKPGIDEIHSGAVLYAAGDQGHLHGACHSSPFKVVALFSDAKDDDLSDDDDDDDEYDPLTFSSVYSSETGISSDLISIALPGRGIFLLFVTHFGNTLHWVLMMMNSPVILEYDLETHRLSVTKMPPGAPRGDNVQIIQAEDGAVGFAALSGPRHCPCLQMWDRKVDSHGVATWVLRKTVELQKILGLESRIEGKSSILNYMEDVQAILLRVQSSVYMIQLESLQPKKLFESRDNCIYRPFTCFYAEGVFSSLKQKQLITG